ncbi:MAG: undecaprenyl-diphosphate phosphatase [Planctomycetes bacterium]|nr:undecaprenyl-diphosphate phosphatase [Planctomycetota bacterium]
MDLVVAAKAAVIGIVEGLTEFLPISSTGHIIITERLLRFQDPNDVFAVVIQLGAILAVCWYYRARLWSVVAGLRGDPASRRFAWSVTLAFLPAAVFGALLNDWLEVHVFDERALAVISATMIIGGILILLIERRTAKPAYVDSASLPWKTALGIGLFQVLAMIPGVSRSGASILGGMLIGVERKAATEFSFFLAIPIMMGASTLKLAKHLPDLTAARMEGIAVGFAVSFIVALAVVHWLLRFVAGHSFAGFGWYRIVAGLALAAALWLGWIDSALPTHAAGPAAVPALPGEPVP